MSLVPLLIQGTHTYKLSPSLALSKILPPLVILSFLLWLQQKIILLVYSKQKSPRLK